MARDNSPSFWGRFIGIFCGFLLLRAPGALFGYFIGWMMDHGFLKATVFMSHNAQDAFDNMHRSYGRESNDYKFEHEHPLSSAYGILGVSSNINDLDLKKAYRKLMSQNHPDKLLAQGLSDKEIKMANEKTQNIKKAYELIKKYRENQYV